jgi:hypothetical protein
MFTLREVNQMEWEMCGCLEWELNVDTKTLKSFEAMVRKDFNGPGPYPVYVLSMFFEAGGPFGTDPAFHLEHESNPLVWRPSEGVITATQANPAATTPATCSSPHGSQGCVLARHSQHPFLIEFDFVISRIIGVTRDSDWHRGLHGQNRHRVITPWIYVHRREGGRPNASSEGEDVRIRRAHIVVAFTPDNLFFLLSISSRSRRHFSTRISSGIDLARRGRARQ